MPFPRLLPVWLVISVLAAPLAAADAAGPAPAGALPADKNAGAPAADSSASARAAAPAKPAAAAPAGVANPADDGGIPAEIVARATPKLKKLVERQDALLAALEKSKGDQDGVKNEIQTLIFDYDDLLRMYPNFAPAYVTYGLLLGKVGMRRESVSLLLKANQIDPNIPIVKNQIGNYLAEEGEPVEAANYFISAIRLAPDEPLYHYQLGTLLAEARDDFLKSGLWTRVQIDRTMQQALRRAAELAPKNYAFAYSYAQSFYNLADPDWEEALKAWAALEDQALPGLEKETLRLHTVNILIKEKKFDRARLLLATVTAEPLKVQKQKLLDQLPANTEK